MRRTSIPTGGANAFWMGDILSFIEKAGEAIDQKQAVEMQAEADRERVHAGGFPRPVAALRSWPARSLLDMMPRWAC